jgi:hypothetical protein
MKSRFFAKLLARISHKFLKKKPFFLISIEFSTTNTQKGNPAYDNRVYQ